MEGPGQNLIVAFQKWNLVVQSNPQRLLCLGTRWVLGISEGSSPAPSFPPAPHQWPGWAGSLLGKELLLGAKSEQPLALGREGAARRDSCWRCGCCHWRRRERGPGLF